MKDRNMMDMDSSGMPDNGKADQQVVEQAKAMEMQEASGDGILRAIAELPQDTILTEQGLAKIFNRHPSSIKRAVKRGELPPPVRMFGKPCWTAQAVLDHMIKRLEAAKRDAERLARRISGYGI